MRYPLAFIVLLLVPFVVAKESFEVKDEPDGILGLLKDDTEDLLVDDTDDDDTDDSLNDTDDLSLEHRAAERKIAECKLNLRPVIGILAQEPGRYMQKALDKHNMSHIVSYIAASYVKSFESAGARVVPIMINKNSSYYRYLANSLNGFVFPGGAAKIDDRSGYGRAGDMLYEHVMEANRNGNTLPLWSTCLGFEMLMYLGANRTNPLSRCKASNTADTLQFRPGGEDNILFKEAPDRLIHALKTQNITSNFHKYCVTPKKFVELGLDEDFDLLSTSLDTEGVEYVSTVAHKSYPVFGTQWHPEKPAYEWREDLTGIPHSKEAVEVNNHIMGVFTDFARLNHNHLPEEDDHLIYNHSPFPVQTIYRSSFLQVYLFDETD